MRFHNQSGNCSLVAKPLYSTGYSLTTTSSSCNLVLSHVSNLTSKISSRSINLIYNQVKTLVVEQSFDAWGRYRNPATWKAYSPSEGAGGGVPNWLLRGYTGHEHHREFALINMNGRMYDPVLGRMLSPDNYIQEPYNTQNYNRYSYCLNNPLKYIDPSGWNTETLDDLINSGGGYNNGSGLGVYQPISNFVTNQTLNMLSSNGSERGYLYKKTKGHWERATTNNSTTTTGFVYDKEIGKLTLREVPITDVWVPGKNSIVEIAQGGWGLNTANDWFKFGSYTEGGLGAVQIGMRNSSGIMTNTFGNFLYKSLGLTRGVLGKAGIAGALVNTGVDYSAMQNKEIEVERFLYRTAGTLGSLYGGATIGTALGGPWGAVGGTIIGGGIWAGEKMYDGYIYWHQQTSIYLTNFNNGLKNGWVPGRY